MKYFKYLIFFFAAFGCGNEKRNLESLDNNIVQSNINMIDSLKDKIQVSSLRSIKDQIEITGFDKDQIDKLNSLASSYSDTSSVRNDFFNFIRNDFKNWTNNRSTIYLIELERSGEVFQASNIIYFSGEENGGYRYDFENGHWMSKGKLIFNFSFDVFFDSLKYKNQCDNGDYASIDNLSITKVIGNEVSTKIIIVLCKKEIPKQLLSIL